MKLFRLLFGVLVLLCFSSPLWAKLPYYPIQFPRDEAAHFKNVPYPVRNLTEWWFYNGKLTSQSGRKLGYYMSYFYMQTEVKGKMVAMPQFALQVVDLDKQKTYAYGVFSLEKDAHFSTEKLDVALAKGLTLQKVNDAYVLKGDVKSRQGAKIHFSLQLTPTRDVLLANEKGMVDMWGDMNSYYYSYTHLNTAGSIQIGKEKFELNPQQSLSWMDHQWGDFVVLPGETQWLYANVQLENGIELHLGLSVNPNTKETASHKMSIMMPDGKKIFTRNFHFVPRIVPGEKFPLSYDLLIPEINLKLNLSALSPRQAENLVWEGVSHAQGSYQSKAIKGQAFTENTVM